MAKPDEAHKLTDKELKKLEKRIAAEYKKAADEMQGKVDAYFMSFAKRDKETKALIGTVVNGKEYTEQDYNQWRITQIARGKRFKTIRDQLAERMTHANEIAISYVNGEIPKIYSLNNVHTIEYVQERMGDVISGIDFTIYNEKTARRLLVKNPDLMPFYPKEKAIQRGIDLAYGKKKITETVTSGILQGKAINSMAKNLMNTIYGMEKSNAIRAARTAFTQAENAGRQAGFEELAKKGVILKKIWVAVHDSRTREDHINADGQEKGEDQPFVVGGEELMYPGDSSLGASGWNLYNCRCSCVGEPVGFKSVLTNEQRNKANIRVIG